MLGCRFGEENPKSKRFDRAPEVGGIIQEKQQSDSPMFDWFALSVYLEDSMQTTQTPLCFPTGDLSTS